LDETELAKLERNESEKGGAEPNKRDTDRKLHDGYMI